MVLELTFKEVTSLAADLRIKIEANEEAGEWAGLEVSEDKVLLKKLANHALDMILED